MKSAKPKMTRDTVPTGFTLSLVLVDALPVLFFSATAVLLGLLLRSPLFLFGAALVLFAGAMKVLWKLLVVKRQKNVWWMFLQMRILMPLGMLLMLAALLLCSSRLSSAALWAALTALPSAVFFAFGLAGMLLMTIFAFTLDASSPRSNWIEQLTNAIAQACFFVGVLLILI